MSETDELILIVYAPALADETGLPLAIVQGMERALPGLRLEWTISDEGHLIPLPQRDAWLAQGSLDGRGFPLVCNGEGDARVTISGHESPARFSPGGRALFEVHAHLPLDTPVLASAVDVLEILAESAHAYWGHATPFNAAVEIAEQTASRVFTSKIPPRGLPMLKAPENIHTPEVPHRLGWLNYWSAATAEALGFPDPARDADLLSRARRTPSGGWVVRLTETPLDLNLSAHLDTLLRAYERFPQVGGRISP